MPPRRADLPLHARTCPNRRTLKTPVGLNRELPTLFAHSGGPVYRKDWWANAYRPDGGTVASCNHSLMRPPPGQHNGFGCTSE
jgi:hypothetical protein